MVINVGALKSGDLATVERDIEAVTTPCRDCGATSKVIIEAALLTDDEKVTACTLAKAAGADYVKTSTGFGPGGATAADVALMRRVVGAEMGVKAAGGVRDLQGLKAMVAAGATRVGASAGVKILQEARGEKPVRATAVDWYTESDRLRVSDESTADRVGLVYCGHSQHSLTGPMSRARTLFQVLTESRSLGYDKALSLSRLRRTRDRS